MYLILLLWWMSRMCWISRASLIVLISWCILVDIQRCQVHVLLNLFEGHQIWSLLWTCLSSNAKVLTLVLIILSRTLFHMPSSTYRAFATSLSTIYVPYFVSEALTALGGVRLCKKRCLPCVLIILGTWYPVPLGNDQLVVAGCTL